jgi:glycosyltransferase involved in cell wall biosynthesis
VQSAIAALNIVVHASTIGEPFGQVIIEGMGAGRPVIATYGGGVPEIVQDKVTGLLTPMNDEHSLADAMRILLRDPASAEEMGRKGRERAREFFNLQRTAAGVEHVYTELMSARKRQRGWLSLMTARRTDA